MRTRATIIISILALVASGATARNDLDSALHNPSIDMESHLALATEAAAHRESRRLTESEFIRMAAERGTIVLDARSRDKYDELHVAGAINLPFPDITVDSLAAMLPDKSTRILIYCNNNFENAEGPFPTKIAPASLNVSTYVTLFEYGYRNVYELGPLLDAETTAIAFEGTWSPRQTLVSGAAEG